VLSKQLISINHRYFEWTLKLHDIRLGVNKITSDWSMTSVGLWQA